MENKCLFESSPESFCSETTSRLTKLSECRSYIDDQLRRWHLGQHIGSVREHDSISLKLSRGDLGSITNFRAQIWRYFQNAGRCERRNRRKRLEFVQIPPVTSPDIFTFFLRIYIRGTHFKRFADLRQQFILIHLSL